MRGQKQLSEVKVNLQKLKGRIDRVEVALKKIVTPALISQTIDSLENINELLLEALGVNIWKK